NMIVTWLGLGMLMSLFTIVVQNAFPFSKLGQVTAAISFFRSIGGTIGVAVLGSIMTNRFIGGLQANLPASVKQAIPADKLALFENPELLMSPEAMTRVQQGFGALGPQGPQLFNQLLQAIRLSLSQAITELFYIGVASMLVAFISTLFLEEIPLRKSHRIEAPETTSQQSTRPDEDIIVEPVL